MNPGLSKQSTPGLDQVSYVLFDKTEHTSDTIAAGDYLIIGPFPLNKGSTSYPQFKSFNLLGAGLAAGDTAQVAYQICATNLITDTASNWTAFDSINAVSGPRQTTVDISSKTGNYIWFQIYNITGSAINMFNKQYAMFRRNVDFYIP